MTAPDWMLGLWRRHSICRPGGRRDGAAQVYWLQTRSAFADLRIPDDPALPVEGFAGHIAWDGRVCTWHRELDLNPSAARPDAGLLRRSADGRQLIERGVHEAYVEDWRRADSGVGGLLAFRPADGGLGCLVVAGSHLIAASGRDGQVVIRYARRTAEGWRISLASRSDPPGPALSFAAAGGLLTEGPRRWRLTESSLADPWPVLLTGGV